MLLIHISWTKYSKKKKKKKKKNEITDSKLQIQNL